jgi:hypothetical protein
MPRLNVSVDKKLDELILSWNDILEQGHMM